MNIFALERRRGGAIEYGVESMVKQLSKASVGVLCKKTFEINRIALKTDSKMGWV